jgi:hypothetical protein
MRSKAFIRNDDVMWFHVVVQGVEDSDVDET